MQMEKPNLKQNVIASLLKTGTRGISDVELTNRIENINKIALAITCFCLLVGPLMCSYLHFRTSFTVPLFVVLLINSSVLFLNYKRKYLCAALTLYYLHIVTVPYFGYIIKGCLPLELVVVLEGLVGFLIFRQHLLRAVAIAACLLDLVFIEILFKHNAEQPILPLDEMFIVRVMIIFTLMCIIILVSLPLSKGRDLSYELYRANQLIKLFAQRITHDLKQPINTLSRTAEMMKSELRKSEPSLETMGNLADLAYQTSANGQNILSNITDLTDVETGRSESIKNETFLLRPFFKNVQKVNALLAEMHGMTINLVIDDMPSSIIADPFSLSQITTNLLVNAIEHGTRGIITMEIRRVGALNWQIKVTNPGPGIQEDKLETIFEPYVSTKPGMQRGTGLGLYIVKSKVLALGGSINVQSDHGVTTTFTVNLPLNEGHLSDLPAEELTKILETDISQFTVIVAEDKPYGKMALKYQLGSMVRSLIICNTGQELLEKAAQIVPDIIIVDYYMPDCLGNNLIKQIKESSLLKGIPIIAYSAGTSGELQAMIVAGADACAQKDTQPDGLLFALRQCSWQMKMNLRES